MDGIYPPHRVEGRGNASTHITLNHSDSGVFPAKVMEWQILKKYWSQAFSFIENFNK